MYILTRIWLIKDGLANEIIAVMMYMKDMKDRKKSNIFRQLLKKAGPKANSFRDIYHRMIMIKDKHTQTHVCLHLNHCICIE